MSAITRIPDAMPDITPPTALVVCDGHHCRILLAGGRTIAEHDSITSVERESTERESQLRGPTGVTSGSVDFNQIEEHRLRTFANSIISTLQALHTSHGAQHLRLSAPGKLLSHVRSHLPKALQGIVESTEAMLTKESPIALLTRFRPDLAASAQSLRDQETLGPAKQPKKK